LAEPPLRWLLLIHQLPPKPAYFRVKVWRQLQALGSVALKNSVYALPFSEDAREDFQWMVRQIGVGGGEASVVEAMFVEGLTDGELRERFRAARDEDYGKLQAELQSVLHGLPQKLDVGNRDEAEAQLVKFRKRFEEILAVDCFEAKGAAEVRMRLAHLEARLAPALAGPDPGPFWRSEDLKARTWVTRKGLHVDRIACAWMIRRFLDPEATFRFVEAKAAVPPGALRFDMFEGEFTHEGDRCSFETLLHRLGFQDAALHALGEVIHDVDLKDGKFKRPEVPGFDRAILGVVLLHARDEDRLAAGSAVLEAFYAAFQQVGK
jgi:hypothetical protein